MSNYSNYEATKEIIQRISKKIPQGIMIGNTTVGHITWQMYLMRDYLKLDGTPLANASNDYSDLLKFAQDNNLITADTSDKSLFKYDTTNNVLTLPDFIGLVVQGGSTVEEKEAGLPNIEGQYTHSTVVTFNQSEGGSGAIHWIKGTEREAPTITDPNFSRAEIHIDASRSNPIYGNSTTVQPPAITLIPQIKYKKATVYEGIELGENYSTEEKRIGTWIDGKPLYQKTVQFTTPSSQGLQSYSFLPDIPFVIMDTLVDINGFAYRSDGWTVHYLFSYEVNSNWFYLAWNKSEQQIYIYVVTLTESVPATLTFKYTKTTD